MSKMKELPDGWEMRKLESVADLQAGKFVSASEISNSFSESLYPCYGGNGLRGYVPNFSHRGAFALIGRQGALCGNVKKVSGKFYATEHAVVVTPKFYADVNWLYYQLVYEDLNKYATGMAQPGLSVKNIKDLLFVVPPLSEQKAIADLLSTWDEAIERTEKLIKAKEKKFKGLIQKLINKRCEEWEHIKPENIFDTVSDKNHPEEELLSVTQDRGVIPRTMREGRVMSPEGSQGGYKLIKRDDFAISLRSFQGGIEHSDYQGIISPAYTVLRTKIEIGSEFYKIFFKSTVFIKKYLRRAIIGIRDGKQVSIPDFLSIKIPVPSLPEQKEIAKVLSVHQKEIDLLKQLVEKYKKQKRGLMQKLLTGTWRIKTEVVSQYE